MLGQAAFINKKVAIALVRKAPFRMMNELGKDSFTDYLGVRLRKKVHVRCSKMYVQKLTQVEGGEKTIGRLIY